MFWSLWYKEVKFMFKSSKLKSSLAISLVISIVLVLSCTSIVSGQVEPPIGIQEKLLDISEEEKQILQSLFTLTQEIEIMENEEKVFAQEIEIANQELISLEGLIVNEEANYAKNQEALKKVLKIYQKMGPGSYLEIIMDSDNLSTLLRRLNTFRDLTRNTGRLLEKLEVSKDRLSIEKGKLAERLVLIKEKQKQSKEALATKLKLKDDKEVYLASLKDKSNLYQEYLTNLEKMLSELKPLLSKAGKEFSGIVADGSLPRDALKISISIFNIKGTIDEKTFNDLISRQTSLKEMVFEFNTDEIEISIPDKKLVLYGDFVINEVNVLSFQAEKGSFFGMPLEQGYIKELLSEGDLALDLKPLLGRNTLQSIKLMDGYIELNIKPNLF
jgi:peptidoglycan hydrolase CwlO-like protein